MKSERITNSDVERKFRELRKNGVGFIETTIVLRTPVPPDSELKAQVVHDLAEPRGILTTFSNEVKSTVDELFTHETETLFVNSRYHASDTRAVPRG